MALMFLRELVEQPVYPQYQQTYGCPMMKCYEKFPEPFQLVQHLLSCSELPNGEFDCDKCNNWHEFPTNEKDWSLWSGWSSKFRNHSHTQGPDGSVQRKRSFSSKMRETFTLRKRDPRKSHEHGFGSRPGTATSAASSMMTMNRCPEHQQLVFPPQATGPSFADMQKSTIPTGAPQIDSSMFWPTMGTDSMSDLHSAVSSIAPSISRSSIAASSTFETETTKGVSANTSTTTLFNHGLPVYQSPTTDVMTSPQYIFPQHPSFDNCSTPLGGQRSSSAMSIDEPITEGPLSPADTATPTDNRRWWGVKQEMDTARPTPVASPFYGMEPPMVHPLHRTLSQSSMQSSAMSGIFQRALSEGTSMDAMSTHDDQMHDHSHHNHHGQSMTGRSSPSPTEDLVCDECQWKPRGVRENLRGYLRKHKNTHKGLRLPCDVVGCTKTFSRLDNLKKHKKDKHGIDDPGSILPLKRVAEEYEHIEQESVEDIMRRPLTEDDIRQASGDYSMLWPALHF